MVNWYTCRKRFSIDSRFFLYFHVLVVDEYKKFEVSAWILDCATSNLMPSDAAVQSQFSWLSEDFPKGTVQQWMYGIKTTSEMIDCELPS
jgi:hypothetical protein